ncbi:NAD-dependent dihydropyrimidine dehydrogenase PreA subunit [Azomonas agilis]|uniref:NAD-dependent dihydropyrimidine dehydrogenase PreA subunit n=1 Tax=Azomonas agilis TaxID=116849 RepID=A0A562IYE9_9GAMM|nr:ferredoxin family protein [Azomonas agilis]TWH75922.1 NAD-dependent dihydropyrimidine dehydrogenase PreA subunit [Azomonas agilis]
MIEVVIRNRCTGCQKCLEVCPAQVFELGVDGLSSIARQQDCQSCYMCELYCTSDALYVSPNCEQPEGIDEQTAEASGTLGYYRRYSGWDEWAGQHPNRHWVMGSVFQRAKVLLGPTKNELEKH